MSLMNWFEDKRRFGGLIGASIEKATKGYILSERKNLKLILRMDYGLGVIIVKIFFMLDF